MKPVHFKILRSVLLTSVLTFIFISCAKEEVAEKKRDYLTPETLCGTVTFKDG